MGGRVSSSGSEEWVRRLETSWGQMDDGGDSTMSGGADEEDGISTNGFFITKSGKVVPEEVMELLLSYVDVKDVLAVSKVGRSRRRCNIQHK